MNATPFLRHSTGGSGRSALMVLAAALALQTAPSVARAEGSPILPGYWESNESYSVLLSGGGHDRKCLTKALIEKFISAPSLKRYDCTYASRSLQDGRAQFSGGACYSHKGRKVLSGVMLRGTFSPESFHLDARFSLMVSAGVGLPGTASIDPPRISAEFPPPHTTADADGSHAGG